MSAISTFRELIQQTIESIPWQTKLQPTLPAEQVHFVLHEPAILAGYRVMHRPWRYYFYSLFQLHNETVNVWTHIIGCLWILHKLYGHFDEFDLAVNTVLTTLFAFGISCLIGLATSACVHLIHSKSPCVHFVAFMVDYMGATMCSFGSGISGMYGYSHPGTYHLLKDSYLTVLFVSSYLNFVNLCMAKIWYGHDPHNLKRKYMFISGMGIQALINIAPFVARYITCYMDETCSMWSLNHLTIVQIVFLLEALTFVAHQPEKTWPGKFDIVGHGHQIFHVLIVLNHVFQMDAIYWDHQQGLLGHSQPDGWLILGIMAFLYMLEAITLIYIIRFLPESLQKVKQ